METEAQQIEAAPLSKGNSMTELEREREQMETIESDIINSATFEEHVR